MKKAILLFVTCLWFLTNICMAVDITCVDISGTEYEEAVNTLSSSGIMTGYSDGTFRPKENISRAEFAAIITRLLSLGTVAAQETPQAVFEDVAASHWAVREIKTISDKKIMSGFDDGSFRPDDDVTYEQAVKIIVQALGFGDQAIKKGGYPFGYLMMAAELGVTKKAAGINGQSVSRGLTAKLLFNTLNVPLKNGVALMDSRRETIYYVSPKGSDSNPGTQDKPWKTMSYAASTMNAGSTAIFEDGIYHETKLTVFKNSGKEGAPITLKAKNKHKAVIIYDKSMRMQGKLQIKAGQEYINVQNFEFTQESTATDSDSGKTSDMFLVCRGNYSSFVGNKCYNVYEDGIKISAANYILVEGNTIIGAVHEGIDILNVSNSIIKNNEIINCGRVGVMVKGNSRNNLLYNNYVRNSDRTMKGGSYGFTIGGATNNTSPFDIAEGTGFENYFCVFYNNVVISEKPGLINTGFGFIGAKGCQVYNNIVIGAREGFSFSSNPGLANGWGWNAPTIDAVVKNNILMDCETVQKIIDQPKNLMFENNLYYRVGSGTDTGGKVGDPKFVDASKDWRLQSGSPAIDAGKEMPSEIKGYNGETLKIDLVDYEGKPRTGQWDIGIYNAP